MHVKFSAQHLRHTGPSINATLKIGLGFIKPMILIFLSYNIENKTIGTDPTSVGFFYNSFFSFFFFFYLSVRPDRQRWWNSGLLKAEKFLWNPQVAVSAVYCMLACSQLFQVLSLFAEEKTKWKIMTSSDWGYDDKNGKSSSAHVDPNNSSLPFQ